MLEVKLTSKFKKDYKLLKKRKKDLELLQRSSEKNSNAGTFRRKISRP